MADIVDPETRSRMMAAIRGSNTKPEIALRKALHARGLRFRLHDPKLPGRPDVVLPKYRAVIFVHGCFWHRHEGCRYATTPKTRPEFWEAKFQANVDRDKRNLEQLHAMGWHTLVVWECNLKARNAFEVALAVDDWLTKTILKASSLFGRKCPICHTVENGRLREWFAENRPEMALSPMEPTASQR